MPFSHCPSLPAGPRPCLGGRRTLVGVAILGSFLLAGCAPPSSPAHVAPARQLSPPASSPSSPPAPSEASSSLVGSHLPADPTFREVGQEAGLNYKWTVEGKRPLNILQTIGNGCAFLDYDGDGNLDILLVGPKLALYRGDGKGHFADVTRETGLDKYKGHFLGCAVGDYDNDGYDDIYISGYRTGLLLHNEAAKKEKEKDSANAVENPSAKVPTRFFQDVTRQAGLGPQPWGTSCGWADLDNDGWLDLYVCNYVHFDPAKDLVLCPFKGEMTGCGPNDYDAAQGVLFHNERGRRFRDVTQAWKVATHGKGLGIAFADFDRSGHPSFAVANDLQPGDLFQKRGHAFVNLGAESGTSRDDVGQTHAGMGIDWGDYDNDGRLDLLVTTFRDETKCLYHNEGYRMFRIVSNEAGVEEPALPYVGWGCKFFDADNDGWLDLLLAHGHVQDNISRFEKTTYREPTLFLHNKQGAPTRFADESRSAGLARLPAIVGRGLAVGDYDNDGRVDALVVDSEGRPLLLHNETPASNAWIGFRLRGSGGSNRSAYGASVTVRAGQVRRLRQCQPGGSYLSSSDARVHIGLGDLTLQSATVLWPDGKVQSWTNLQPNRYYTIREGESPQ